MSLGYSSDDIKIFPDLEAQQMMDVIIELASRDHTNSSSIVIVFLAYGEHNVVYAKDRNVGVQWLLSPLKGDLCHESLVGKPKIIILQTCNPTEETKANDDEKVIPVKRTIPCEADFAYVGTEVPGDFLDQEKKGSMLIRHITQQLTNHNGREFRQIITRVLQAVEREMDEKCKGWSEQYDDRMPYFISMLTRDLRFPVQDVGKGDGKR